MLPFSFNMFLHNFEMNDSVGGSNEATKNEKKKMKLEQKKWTVLCLNLYYFLSLFLLNSLIKLVIEIMTNRCPKGSQWLQAEDPTKLYIKGCPY